MTIIDDVSTNDMNFKHLDTAKDIVITPRNEFGGNVLLNTAHTWTAKVSDGNNYVGDYPVTLESNSIVVNSSDFTNLPAGYYHLEIWEEWIDSNGTKQRSIYPSPQRTIDFTIYQNVTDLAEKEIKTIGFQDVVDQAVMNIGMNYVFKVNTIETDQTATVVQTAADGKNYVTFNIPRGAKGDKGDPGTYDLSKTGVTPLSYWDSGSFNDLPLGTVFADGNKMTDGPNANHGFTTTTFYSTQWNGRKAQIAISDRDNFMYLRVGGVFDTSFAWNSWTLLADGDFYKPGKMTNVDTGSPYDDLNTFPIGQTVTIAETPDKIKQIKNLPPISNTTGGLTVRTESSINDTLGGIQIAIDNNNVMYHRICWGASGQWGAWRSDSVGENSNDKILPTLSLFQKVGIVGDSYASGELAFDGKYVDHYEISWLQILARKDGFNGTNFSKGGMSTRTWLTDPKCMPLMQSSDAQDLYILALGINDEALGTSYIGSEADIDTGSDTFYGNYGKIIKAIQVRAPQAKIVIATIADSSDIATKLNEAITTIANHFTIPVIVQLDDPLFNSSFYKDNMIGGHPTGPVYASMAEAFERLIGQSMINHLDYYKTFRKDA